MPPPKLQAMIDLFAGLPEGERRSLLIDFAAQSAHWAPTDDERFDLEDVRKDAECTDTVGIFLRAGSPAGIHFKVSLGPEVQTLTRALATILCRGLDGASAQEILQTPADFVPKIVGAELIRLRSQTVYYVLNRMKSAVEAHLRMGSIQTGS